jgi:hypothetical protein
VDPDEALIQAWNLGDRDDAWSEPVIEIAEQLLPILIAAGYAEATDTVWRFTPEGIARAMEIEGGPPPDAS